MKILSVDEVMQLFKDWSEPQINSQLDSLKLQLAREQDHIQQTINDITALENLIKIKEADG